MQEEAALSPDEVEAFTESITPFLRAFEGSYEGRSGAGDWLGGVEVMPDVDPGLVDLFEFDGRRFRLAESMSVAGETFQWTDVFKWLPGFSILTMTIDAYAKVIGVELEDARDGVRTLAAHLRVELGGSVEGERKYQAVLRFETTWAVSGDEPPVLTALRCTGAEYVRRTSGGPAFVEKTAGLLAGDPSAAHTLGIGMDRWAQRLDDPGMTAFFGHQGLAAGDVTGDGLPDLYVAMPAGIPNMLLVQQPDGTAKDMAREQGVAWLDDTKGVLIQDLDGDGAAEIVSALGHVLVVQVPAVEGESRTYRVAAWGAAPDEAPFYSIAASDVDGDGMAELFGTRYMATRYADTVPVPFDEARNGPGNCLFKFDGRRFLDVTEDFGLRESDGGRFSLAAQFVDVDQDGDEDLYVVNDFGSNRLWRLKGKRFVDATGELGLADRGAGMGASWGDADGDGDLDVYVTNMFSSAGQRVALQASYAPELPDERREGARQLTRGSSLLRMGEDGRFMRDAGAGVSMGRWGWGGIFAELNGDGRLDIVAPAGFLTGPKPGDL